MGTKNFRGYWNLVNRHIAKMRTVDAMTLCRAVCSGTGQHFDWHEFSLHLEHLASVGVLEYAGMTSDGHQIYRYLGEEVVGEI